MNYQEYINQNRDVYEHFLCFLDEESHYDELFTELINIIQKYKYKEDPNKFKTILYLISKVSQNHYRSDTFLAKIERILTHYKEYLIQNYSTNSLFKIFRKNPQILLFLFEMNIIPIDDSIIKLILKKSHHTFVVSQFKGQNTPDYHLEKEKKEAKKSIFSNYEYYFFMSIKSKLNEKDRAYIENELLKMDENIFDDFEKKCRAGENDSYISKLIREDSIVEFIIYVNQTNISLNSKIKPSIFETNPLLIKKEETLIEYAGFFGSIQVFNYLLANNVELTPSLWIYVIHGNNPEMINILEDNSVEPLDPTYVECLKESIKCHHNDISQYIEYKISNESIEINEINFRNNPIYYGFHYYNFKFIQIAQINENLLFSLFYACLFDHFNIVETLIKENKVDFNQSIVFFKYNNL